MILFFILKKDILRGRSCQTLSPGLTCLGSNLPKLFPPHLLLGRPHQPTNPGAQNMQIKVSCEWLSGKGEVWVGSSAAATATAGREVAAAVVAVLAGAAAVDGGPAGTAPATAPAVGAGNFAASRGHGLAGGTSRGPAAGPPTSTLARWSTPSGPGGRAAACAVLGGPNGRGLEAGPVQTSAHHHRCLPDTPTKWSCGCFRNTGCPLLVECQPAGHKRGMFQCCKRPPNMKPSGFYTFGQEDQTSPAENVHVSQHNFSPILPKLHQF